MFQRLAIAAALAAASTAGLAQTVVGGATIIETAVVHPGTVSASSFLTYVSGGDGVTGTANGTSFAYDGVADPAAAMAAADHRWLQFDPGIFMSTGGTLVNSVLAIPDIDHGWEVNNNGENWEPFEFKIWGCTSATPTACTEGTITDVYTRGIDDTGASKNADDFATVWAFGQSYSIFWITSGDHLSSAGHSPGEGEIDALAIPGAVPEPETYALFAAGLGALAFVSRRQKRRR
ncbi:MAG TPA: PEP-CTERM sorting domain-containing protein [Caldimonas sp.]|jgi:hypothetical protein